MTANNRGLATWESDALRQMREALGAVAVAPAAVYRLHSTLEGWQVSGDAGTAENFSSREMALAVLHSAVVRCAAYCLYLQNGDGCTEIECRNWPLNAIAPAEEPHPACAPETRNPRALRDLRKIP